MASYFDAQPPSKADSAFAGVPDEETFGKPSMLSPQVTRILDDLDDHSSSEDEVGESGAEKDEEEVASNCESTTPSQARGPPNPPPPRPGLGAGGRGRGKSPHLARFHSLRSMLFSSHIEDDIAKCRESEAEVKWREEHEQRRGLMRPKTPESPKSSPTREGFAHKLGNRLRRMTSKEAPTMKSITEDDNDSTASSDDEEGAAELEMGKKHDETVVSDDESIRHSDVEDLVRWVSRRDPPSDGEGRPRQPKTQLKVKEAQLAADDSGCDSIGHSDVEDLVRWVSRRPESTDVEVRLPSDYSEASTASDSEVGARQHHDNTKDDLGDDDVEELVRWVSRKEGPRAGPLKNQGLIREKDESQDSDGSDLVRWVTKKDDTSGESDIDSTVGRTRKVPARRERKVGQESSHRPPLKESMTHDDVDDLVKWISQKHDNGHQERRDTYGDVAKARIGQSGTNPEIETREQRGSLDHGDVDELVRWVSRK